MTIQLVWVKNNYKLRKLTLTFCPRYFRWTFHIFFIGHMRKELSFGVLILKSAMANILCICLKKKINKAEESVINFVQPQTKCFVPCFSTRERQKK